MHGSSVAKAQAERQTPILLVREFVRSREISRIEAVMRGSTLDKFLTAVPDATVQVVPLSEAAG